MDQINVIVDSVDQLVLCLRIVNRDLHGPEAKKLRWACPSQNQEYFKLQAAATQNKVATKVRCQFEALRLQRLSRNSFVH